MSGSDEPFDVEDFFPGFFADDEGGGEDDLDQYFEPAARLTFNVVKPEAPIQEKPEPQPDASAERPLRRSPMRRPAKKKRKVPRAKRPVAVEQVPYTQTLEARNEDRRRLRYRQEMEGGDVYVLECEGCEVDWPENDVCLYRLTDNFRKRPPVDQFFLRPCCKRCQLLPVEADAY